MAGTTISCGMTSMIEFIKAPASASSLSSGSCFQSIAQPAVDGFTLAVSLEIDDAWEGGALAVRPLAVLSICLFISFYSAL